MHCTKLKAQMQGAEGSVSYKLGHHVKLGRGGGEPS